MAAYSKKNSWRDDVGLRRGYLVKIMRGKVGAQSASSIYFGMVKLITSVAAYCHIYIDFSV